MEKISRFPANKESFGTCYTSAEGIKKTRP
jgi:hypothetical protein